MKVAADVPPNLTAVAPVRLVPVRVTDVPTGPLAGVKPVIVGAGVTVPVVKTAALAAVPPAAVTVIVPVVAPDGTTAVIRAAELVVNRAAVPLNATADAPVKPVPLIWTRVPAGPEVGVNPEIVGAAPVIVNEAALDAAPSKVETAISPEAAPAGTTAVIRFSELTVNEAAVPPKATPETELKPVPLI